MSNNRSNKVNLQEYAQNTLSPLPTETKLHIMSFLNRKELATARTICKEWNILAQDRSLPALQVPDYQHASEPIVMADKIVDMTVSDDGCYLAMLSSGKEDNFTLLDTGTNIAKLKMTIAIPQHPNPTNIQLALTPDNKRLIIVCHKERNYYSLDDAEYSLIDVYDLESKQHICKYEDLNQYHGITPIPFIQVISNDRFLVSFTPFWYVHEKEFKKIYLCDVNKTNDQIVDGDSNYEHGYYGASCLSSNKKLFARVINNSIELHDVETGKKIKSISLPLYDLRSLTDIHFLNDNQTLCLITGDLSVTNPGHVYRKDPLNPLVLKINSNDGVVSKWEFCKKTPNEFSNRSVLLPNNHMLAFGRQYKTTTKITILDLNTEKQVKDILDIGSIKKIACNNSGRRIFLLTDNCQLNQINIPLICDLKLQQQEQNVQTEKLRMR